MIRSVKLFVLFFFFFAVTSEAGSGSIILNPMLKSPGQLEVYQNDYVAISNSYNSVLYDITVSESPSQKRVLSIADFQSGQSFEMSFSKAGEYDICFSSEKNMNSLRTCLHVDVLKAKLI
ncbi:MAG: hypothetical protein HOK41_03135 [Nitrospina sp.]|jgi:hypothetical protein|nr:hypothetical protein [Nitrospina sp.]MBT6716756.1 hypothetical protein [Nitrospina sp.]